MKTVRWSFPFKSGKVYILPTAHGVVVLLTVIVMILVGATYGNNLVNTLAFLLFSVLTVSMLQTYSNLKGLSLELLSCEDAFMGSDTSLRARIHNGTGRFRHNIWLEAAELGRRVRTDGIGPKQHQVLNIFWRAKSRGMYSAPRLRLMTKYPLGLFTAWLPWCEFNKQYYIYPKPEGELPLPETFGGGKSTGQESSGAKPSDPGVDEFYEFRRYRSGDPFRRIDWRVSERVGYFVLRTYIGDERRSMKFILDAIRTEDLEQRLSQLAAWVVKAQEQQVSFELVLPKQNPIRGGDTEANVRALQSLAAYGQEVA